MINKSGLIVNRKSAIFYSDSRENEKQYVKIEQIRSKKCGGGNMRVGAATHKIILPDGFLPTEGFARQIDELHVRALVLEKETSGAAGGGTDLPAAGGNQGAESDCLRGKRGRASICLRDAHLFRAAFHAGSSAG